MCSTVLLYHCVPQNPSHPHPGASEPDTRGFRTRLRSGGGGGHVGACGRRVPRVCVRPYDPMYPSCSELDLMIAYILFLISTVQTSDMRLDEKLASRRAVSGKLQ
jgi:hypothetical protein